MPFLSTFGEAKGFYADTNMGFGEGSANVLPEYTLNGII